MENTNNFFAVVGIVMKPGFVLMGQAIDTGDDRTGWLCFPGGGRDGKESVNRAVKREVREETNLLVQPTESIIEDLNKPGVIFVICNYINGVIQHNSEFKNMSWYDINDLPWERIYPQNKELLENLLSTYI